MLRQQWNALHVGARVMVHDHEASGALAAGEVVSVRAHVDGTDVLVRLGDGTLVYPRRLGVHVLPLASNERCWRCDTATPTAPAHNGRRRSPARSANR